MSIIFSCLFASCASTNAGIRPDVFEHQQRVTELEARNKQLEERLAKYDQVITNTVESIEAVRTRAGNMESTVDRIIRLFEEYKRLIEQILRDYNNLQTQTDTEDKSNSNTNNNISFNDNNKTNCICVALKRYSFT